MKISLNLKTNKQIRLIYNLQSQANYKSKGLMGSLQVRNNFDNQLKNRDKQISLMSQSKLWDHLQLVKIKEN